MVRILNSGQCAHSMNKCVHCSVWEDWSCRILTKLGNVNNNTPLVLLIVVQYVCQQLDYHVKTSGKLKMLTTAGVIHVILGLGLCVDCMQKSASTLLLCTGRDTEYFQFLLSHRNYCSFFLFLFSTIPSRCVFWCAVVFLCRFWHRFVVWHWLKLRQSSRSSRGIKGVISIVWQKRLVTASQKWRVVVCLENTERSDHLPVSTPRRCPT